MESKEGMYVRTPLGIAKYLGKYDNIGSLHEFDKLDEELWSGDIYGVVFDCDMKEIVLKASYNIIDLIEVGDYVNGFKVTSVQEVEEPYYPKRLLFVEEPQDNVLKVFNNEDIKSIVTKEQFENMAYKVGD